MNGVHDLGGMHGFGTVVAEPDEPVFHHDWERRCFALTLAAGSLGRWNIDMSRYARERMDPVQYLGTSYYEHWLHGLETLLVEKGLVSTEELVSGRARVGPDAAIEAVGPERMRKSLGRGASTRRETPAAARFAVGDRVVVRNLHPLGHIRAPRYVRGRRGVVDRDHGVFVFPDTNAAGSGEQPQHVYSVRFGARELWGPQGHERDAVYADLWDDYLDPV